MSLTQALVCSTVIRIKGYHFAVVLHGLVRLSGLTVQGSKIEIRCSAVRGYGYRLLEFFKGIFVPPQNSVNHSEINIGLRTERVQGYRLIVILYRLIVSSHPLECKRPAVICERHSAVFFLQHVIP
jgi:hypothetical protein